jgi:hypothetical protein
MGKGKTGQRLRKLEPLVGERQEGETAPAVVACNDYLRMGYRRSMNSLADRYKEQHEETGMKVPTLQPSQLYKWSANFGWVARAEAYDMAKEIERTERSEEIMNSGFALEHERVFALNDLAKEILAEIGEKGLWGVRKKILKTEGGDRVINERFFRKRPIDAIRGVLDDIAKETGGRIQRAQLEVSGLAGMLSQAKGFSDEGIGAERQIEDAKYRDAEDGSKKDDPPSTIADLAKREPQKK